MTKGNVLMALVDDENVVVSKEITRNGKWVKISMRKVHTLLDMKDNDERKSFLDYLCIDLNYLEEQRNNLVIKHRDLVQELNTCKEQLLVLKQSKLDFLTMQHVNTEILKENKNLRIELKELTTITKTWLNNSNKVKQCICVERPWLSESEGLTFPNHDTGRILLAESQVKIIDPLVAITYSSATEYDSADESLVCSTPLPLLEKLADFINGSSVKTPMVPPNNLGHDLNGKAVNETQNRANEVNIDYAKLIWEDIITKINKKTREKFIPNLGFLSLLLEHNIEGYGFKNVTLNPTQVFNVHNWTLKKNQPEGPPFTDHMLSICKAKKHGLIKAPKTSSKDEKNVPKGTKPGAKFGRMRKQIPFTYHHSQSKIEVTKGGSSSKEPTGAKTDHLMRETQSSSAMDSNRSQPSASIPMIGCDASADSTAKADPRIYALNDSISKQQDMDKGTKNYSINHIFACTYSHVLVEQTKYTREGLETVLTQHTTGKGASDIAIKIEEKFNTSLNLPSSKDTPKKIKLEDLSKLVQDLGVNFMDLDLPNDDKPIIIQDESDEEELPTEFLSVPTQVESIHAKIKTLSSKSANRVIEALNKFAQEHIKKEKGKKSMFSKDAEEEGSKSDSDDTIHLTSSMVESFKKKKLKKFDFVTGAKHEVEVRRQELVDLLDLDVVSKYYKAKLR
nr:hypothetical protein [Tanacetum cinerariifolium]